MNRLVVNLDVLRRIERHAASVFPRECCGLLAGEEPLQISEISELENVSIDDREFRVSERDFFCRGTRLLPHGYSIVGVYHSHPFGSMFLSPQDIEGMTFSGIILIAIRHLDEFAFTAYMVDEGKVEGVTIHPVDAD